MIRNVFALILLCGLSCLPRSVIRKRRYFHSDLIHSLGDSKLQSVFQFRKKINQRFFHWPLGLFIANSLRFCENREALTVFLIRPQHSTPK